MALKIRNLHEVKNLLLRGANPITWKTVRETFASIPELGAWISHSSGEVKAYFDAEGTKQGLFYWALATLSAIAVTLWLTRRLFVYANALERHGLEDSQQRVLRTTARLLRRLLHFGLLFVVPWSAAEILPGLPPAVSEFLTRCGLLLAMQYLIWSAYWELLRPKAPDQAIVQPDERTRRLVAIAVYIIIGSSLALQPLRIGMEAFDGAGAGTARFLNTPAHEVTGALYLICISVALSGILFRRSVTTQLLPDGDSTGARFIRIFVTFARPFLWLLPPTLVAMELFRFDILADLTTRYSLALLASLAISLLLYQVVKVLIISGTARAYGDEASQPETTGSVTRGALIYLARLATWCSVLLWGAAARGLQLRPVDGGARVAPPAGLRRRPDIRQRARRPRAAGHPVHGTAPRLGHAELSRPGAGWAWTDRRATRSRSSSATPS